MSSWEGVLDATQYGEVCPQVVLPHGSEDCLSLNVYSPEVNATSKLPVLFFIHGGSFVEGTSRNVRPDFVLEHDMVLVAPQYRLGPLGFLTLATTNRTGNAALYDVLMALRWVRDHIEHFGGDPHRITVSGISAGSAIAALLYLSPLTQDIIKQVMLFSGSALAPWAIDDDPITHSRAIAEELGCYNGTDDDVLVCLQNIENGLDMTKTYFKITNMTSDTDIANVGGTTPVIDKEILSELPEVTMKRNNFNGRPMIMSVTRDEGIFLTEGKRMDFVDANNMTTSSEELKKLLDSLIRNTRIQDPTYIVAPALREMYFPEGERTRRGFVDFLSATCFKGPALMMAKLNSLRNGRTFLTTFNYDRDGLGVDHTADQRYIFPRNFSGITKSDHDLSMKMTKLYANFVIKGAPTNKSERIDGVDWSPFSRSESYLVIDMPVTLKQDFQQEFVVRKQEERNQNIAAGCLVPQLLLCITVVFTSVLYTNYVQ